MLSIIHLWTLHLKTACLPFFGHGSVAFGFHWQIEGISRIIWTHKTSHIKVESLETHRFGIQSETVRSYSPVGTGQVSLQGVWREVLPVASIRPAQLGLAWQHRGNTHARKHARTHGACTHACAAEALECTFCPLRCVNIKITLCQAVQPITLYNQSIFLLGHF